MSKNGKTGVNRITGRSAFLALLKDEGITHLFGNPGTTELPIMHALKEHPDLTYVMAMQESLVVAIADGYSRASGRLVACNVHVAPGLGNAMGSLYNASFTGTPLILTAGQQEQGHGLTEPVLYGPLVQMAAPLVKWAVEVTRLEDLPRIVRRAAKIATTPPTGPVFISLPGDILNAEAGIELGRSTRVDTRVRPSDESLQALAARILKAERPVIVTGDEIVKSDALKAAGGAALESRAKAGVAALAGKNWGAKRKAVIEQISKARDRSPIDPDWLALQLVEAMPDNAILVDEGLTSSRQVTALRPHRDRYGYHALASGGIGWGLPASVGVSMANPERPVVCYSGDGSAMYSIQALWTAAHHKLPLTVVIVNNGGYRIIKQRLLAFHQDDHFVGMDFVDPPVDFAGLAGALGLEAIRVTDAKAVAGTLRSAFNRPGAKLIEVVVEGSVKA